MRTPNCLNAVFVSTGNGELLRNSLDLLVRAWGKGTTSFYDSAVRGMSLFLQRYSVDSGAERYCSEEILVRRMQQTTPKQMLIAAKQSKVIFPNVRDDNAYGLALWNLYNHKLRSSRLGDWSPTWRLK